MGTGGECCTNNFTVPCSRLPYVPSSHQLPSFFYCTIFCANKPQSHHCCIFWNKCLIYISLLVLDPHSSCADRICAALSPSKSVLSCGNTFVISSVLFILPPEKCSDVEAAQLCLSQRSRNRGNSCATAQFGGDIIARSDSEFLQSGVWGDSTVACRTVAFRSRKITCRMFKWAVVGETEKWSFAACISEYSASVLFILLAVY